MTDTASGTPRVTLPPRPVVHTVRVDARLEDHLLQVFPEKIVVKPGDSILWQFSGLQRPWKPVVVLSPGDNDDFLGPFTALTLLPSGVLAPVATEARDGAYTYRAQLQVFGGKGEPVAFLMGPKSTVIVDHKAEGTTHIIDVDLEVDSAKVKKVLTVSKELVEFSRGDTVVWNFSDKIFDNAKGISPLPVVRFEEYDGEETLENLRTGPFNCLTSEPRRVTGTSPNGAAGRYHYQVAMVDSTSGELRWVTSGDPAVDERPEPPEPPRSDG